MGISFLLEFCIPQSQYQLSELIKYILAIVITSLCSYTCMQSAEEPRARRVCSM
jgi:hypothetical protein